MNRFDPDSSNVDITEAVREDGYAIVEGLLNPSELDQLRREITPHLDATDPDAANYFMGARTKRFGGLLWRVPTTRDMIRHPAVLATLDATLKQYGPTYQVHFTGVMHVMQDEKQQVLHIDSTPFVNPGPPVVVATMWAASDFRKENGATVFVPGSHKWPDSRRPRQDELRYAEMPAGSVLIYVGNLIHGAGQCVTGDRTGVALQYSVGWLRQEENQYLSVPIEHARSFPEDLQRLMGYDLAMSNWGNVSQEHPLSFLRQDGIYRTLDPEDYNPGGRVRMLHATEGGVHRLDSFEFKIEE